jgi:hypothetical protein
LYSVNLTVLQSFYDLTNATVSGKVLTPLNKLQETQPLDLPFFEKGVDKWLAADEAASYSLKNVGEGLQNDTVILHTSAEAVEGIHSGNLRTTSFSVARLVQLGYTVNPDSHSCICYNSVQIVCAAESHLLNFCHRYELTAEGTRYRFTNAISYSNTDSSMGDDPCGSLTSRFHAPLVANLYYWSGYIGLRLYCAKCRQADFPSPGHSIGLQCRTDSLRDIAGSD